MKGKNIFILILAILVLSIFIKKLIIQKNPNTCFIQGVILSYLTKYQNAIVLYDKTISMNPNHVRAWYNKGIALYKLGKDKDAIAAFDKTINLDSKYAQAYYNKGFILATLEDHSKAVEEYGKAIAINPNYAEAWQSKGNSLRDLGKNQEAIYAYGKAISINPKLPESWGNKGNLLFNSGKYKEAIEAYGKAIAINPNLGEVWFNQSVAFTQLGLEKESDKASAKWFSMMRDINFFISFAVHFLNESLILPIRPNYALSNNLDLAESESLILPIRPNYAKAWYDFGTIYLNRLYYSMNMKKELYNNEQFLSFFGSVDLDSPDNLNFAIYAFDKAIAIKPNFPEAWNGKGIALEKLGKYKKAINAYAKAIQLNPDYAEPYYNKEQAFKDYWDKAFFKKVIGENPFDFQEFDTYSISFRNGLLHIKLNNENQYLKCKLENIK